MIGAAPTGKPAPDAPPAKRGPILIVEDNHVNVLVLRSMLRKFGYDALVATDGAEGVAMALGFRPRLVLMDINMPGMDGITAAAAIRAEDGDRPTPIVAVTADITAGQRAACHAAGFQGLLLKPIVVNDLIGTVRRWAGEP
jgi:CheY-like chemotaxis protein